MNMMYIDEKMRIGEIRMKTEEKRQKKEEKGKITIQ